MRTSTLGRVAGIASATALTFTLGTATGTAAPATPDGTGDRPATASQQPGTRATGDEVVRIAREQLGKGENPPGSNCSEFDDGTDYGCVEWCALFATWVWNQAGIDIPRYAFTGDMYTWGDHNGRSRWVQGKPLGDISPGDAVLYGTGPSGPESSTHVDIVTEVHPDHLRVIGGNVDEKVTERDVPRAGIYGWVDAG